MPLITSREEMMELRAEYNANSWERDDTRIAKLAKKLNRVMRQFKQHGYEFSDEYKQLQYLTKKYGKKDGKAIPETVGGIKKLSDYRAMNLEILLNEIDATRMYRSEYDDMAKIVARERGVSLENAKKTLFNMVDNLKSMIWKLDSVLSTMGYGTDGVAKMVEQVDRLSASEQTKLFINLVNAKTDRQRAEIIKKFNKSNQIHDTSRPLDVAKRNKKTNSRKMYGSSKMSR